MEIHLITLGILSIFIISLIQDRRKMINGFIFTFLILFMLISMILIIEDTHNELMIQILSLSFVAGLFLVLIASFILIVSLFTSARKLIKREGLRLSNLLSLGLGIIILVLSLLNFIDWYHLFNAPIVALIEFAYLAYYYFMYIFFTFLISSFIYQIYRPRLNKDVIIVLGSGLLQKRFAPPLLQRRIDKAIAIYDRQQKKKRNPKKPLLLFSGGQGADEEVSEAHAMRDYAMHIGIPKEDILLEEKSQSTYENMEFSKQLLEEHFPYGYKAIFTTSNYHVFRASIDAKRVKLNAQGLGAKTPFYFWANAMVREYVAILSMYKALHILIVVLLLLLFIFYKGIILFF